MTDREKAIVMAYTGCTMLAGDKLGIYYKYVQEKLGRSVMTHELAYQEVQDAIKEAAKEDFIAIAKADNGWISVKDRMPEPTEEYTDYIVHIIDDEGNWAIGIAEWDCTLGVGAWRIGPDSVTLPDGMCITHWMETPEPPKEG